VSAHWIQETSLLSESEERDDDQVCIGFQVISGDVAKSASQIGVQGYPFCIRYSQPEGLYAQYIQAVSLRLTSQADCYEHAVHVIG